MLKTTQLTEETRSGMMVNRFASIGIKPRGDLKQTAKVLGEILGGVEFSEELSGRYEEYPAFVAQKGEFEYALLGVPEPDQDIRDKPHDDFVLMMDPLVCSEEENKDVSDELLILVSNDGRLECWALD